MICWKCSLFTQIGPFSGLCSQYFSIHSDFAPGDVNILEILRLGMLQATQSH
jgi:hypothetical protein